MRSTTKATALFAALAIAATALAGCSSSTSPKDDGVISVVASTNVWGDVAKQIGGDAIHVTSIISDPAQDPHSYEANAQVQLALSKADIVIENGGGYDDFARTLLGGAGNSTAQVLNAVNISGYQSTGLNEHIWYDFPTVRKVAARIARSLTALDASRAATFAANARAFDTALGGLEADEAAIKAGPAAGQGVAITEPVPLYLLTASGLVDKTPDAFSEAIEAGTDVAPDVLRQTLALLKEHRVALLAYNKQTGGPETDQVLAAAKAAGVPAIGMTETLPDGKDYIGWMTDNLNAVKAALS
ncbi:metal ABC transporter solute-binding protein, Zn/Mn family [Parafrigoribacterium soli]|uniref:metal ABC transporter solute-binding protein, Zn/Mn family n=1 Tax=Parafrigoribacterium soli TaxID=3144663 RepID=UPI0032EDC334